jgi:hypothetical protein
MNNNSPFFHFFELCVQKMHLLRNIAQLPVDGLTKLLAEQMHQVEMAPYVKPTALESLIP